MRILLFVSVLLGVLVVQATFITNATAMLNVSYEYIVVGGGTTALAVANRLSVEHTVLVIERGPDAMENEVVNDPFTPFGTSSSPSPCHFAMDAPPQVGLNTTRLLPLTHGRCLGGGSSINAMMGSRPTFAGMSALEALGNPGWGWNDFLPFMQKSETFTPPNAEQRADGADYLAVVHGFDGPVGVSFGRPFVAPAMQNAAINASETVYGLSLSPDLGNGFSGGHVAHYYHHVHFNTTLQVDRRSSSAWSYLYPQTQQRAGLTVLTDHIVDTVLTTTESNGAVTATGVTVQPALGGQTISFKATREVIVSAGALYSPAVLQRSGIGNATFLKSLGIHSVLDLPGVGANFQDQILLTNASFPLAPSANTTNVTGGDNILLGVVVSHPTASNAFGPNGTKIIQTALLNSSADFTLSVGGVTSAKSFSMQASVMANAYHVDHPIIELFYNPGGKGLDAWSQSILPLSRGSVRINSTDPTIDPIANPHFLTADVDIQIAIRMARGIAQAATTPPFSDLISKTALADSGLPAPDAADEEIRNWVLATYTPGIHFVGSNSMMPKELGGVVSPELLVYGTTNLRVADASIVPLSVFPHTTLGLYGVAEKAAHMILKAASK
ncbi:alcohol oxidase [Mycena albidolilacea]|uniref:Alcohol oxidase n=1 Tax=Mycena albidolilacea TaxID=1033008 RepID=A0AAD6ZS03_9AGAR|nr:alcohol oxidase [Mycena albidolilacea]